MQDFTAVRHWAIAGSMTDWKHKLIEGYRAFRKGDYRAQKQLYEELGTEGQHPKVMLIACSDSRVDPV